MYRAHPGARQPLGVPVVLRGFGVVIVEGVQLVGGREGVHQRRLGRVVEGRVVVQQMLLYFRCGRACVFEVGVEV